MPAYDLGGHVEDLAKELGVLIIPPWVGSLADEATEFPAGVAGHMDTFGGEAVPIIWISEEPSNAKAYLVALHELGHHATADAADGQPSLTREHLAWQWAEGQSHIPITPRLGAFIAGRLDSYRD